MSSISNGVLSQQITDLIDRITQRDGQLSAWVGGTASGGPNGDGRYPLSDAAGSSVLIPSPAALAASVSGPAALAETSADIANAAADAAQVSETNSFNHKTFAEAARGASIDARDMALIHRNHAGTHEANARYWAELAQGHGANTVIDREVVELLAAQVEADALDAEQYALDAEASALAAATFDPSLYDKKSDTLASSRLTGTIDPARIPILPSQKQFASSGDLTNLTSAQQNEIGQGSIVTTTDGNRWVYSGAGSKTVAGSYVQLADVTPEWSSISDKPSFYPTNISNVSGLQSALDGKSDSGHSHSDATTSAAGFMTAAMVTKLNGIAAGATALSLGSTSSTAAAGNHTHSQYLPLSGGTMTGGISSNSQINTTNTMSSAGLSLVANAGQYRVFEFMTNANRRWALFCDNSTETGVNSTGADLYMQRQLDNGEGHIVYSIERKNGNFNHYSNTYFAEYATAHKGVYYGSDGGRHIYADTEALSFRANTNNFYMRYNGDFQAPYLRAGLNKVFFGTSNEAITYSGGTYFLDNGRNIGTSGTITSGKFVSSSNGSGDNLKIGDDAWIGDTNIANGIRIRGQADATKGTIQLGNCTYNSLHWDGSTHSIGGVLFSSSNVVFANDFNATSDETLKGNWRPEAKRGWVFDMLDAKRGLFDWIDGSGHGLGTSAQQLREVLPAGVSQNEVTGKLAINYGPVAYLAVMDLAEEVKELKAIIADMRGDR